MEQEKIKYRKRPIEVEAYQFTDVTKDMVYSWATSIQMNVTHSWDDNKNPILIVPTLEGEMICSFGDYLVKEPFPINDRKLYPCKPEIFEQTYEIIGVASTPPSVLTSETLVKEVAPTEEKIQERLDQLKYDLQFWTAEIKKEKAKDSDFRDEGYIEHCRENISEFQGEINGINFMMGFLTNREGWVKVEDGDRLVPMSEIESFIKVYNHEYHGKMWTIHSFLTGLNNWLKPKEIKSK